MHQMLIMNLMIKSYMNSKIEKYCSLMRNICVITGSRSEYGLLKPLLKKISDSNDHELTLVATGMHLSEKFGYTLKEIIEDGFKIDYKVDTLINFDSPASIIESTGIGIIKFGKLFESYRPDLIIILGDRFEIFSVAYAGHISKIPIAHIHGGEKTVGAFDDSLRHAITKMSKLHFVSTMEYAKRVIQLGENPDKVFYVGALCLDAIKSTELMNKNDLEKELNFKFGKKNILVTYHPETLSSSSSKDEFSTILAALELQTKINLIFTSPNADTDGRIIIDMINDFVKKNFNRSMFIPSMGSKKYYSTLQFIDGVLGNSSSGIIEAPNFKIGTINIGDRQKGRVQANSTINCKYSITSIGKAIEKLYNKNFKEILKKIKNPYELDGASSKILEIIKNENLYKNTEKEFYDL